MEYRQLLRPLPLLLIFLFVAVAVADLIQTLTEEPPPPPEIAGAAIPGFVAFEPVIDFRSESRDGAIEIGPIPKLAKGQWSGRKPQGVWARGAAAEFLLELADGGHRQLILECRPTSGKRPARSLHLTMNGVDCGSVELSSDWNRYRLVLPDGAVRPGINSVVFHFPDRGPAAKSSRTLLVRKIGLFADGEAGVDSLDDPGPVTLDLEAERASIHRSGVLEIPVLLDDRTDALQMRYRFFSGSGRVEVVVVEQSQDDGVGLDEAMRSIKMSEDQTSGRIRISLHGRRGPFVIRVRADLEPSGSQLLISSLRLVEEGDPTRRPSAANPAPN